MQTEVPVISLPLPVGSAAMKVKIKCWNGVATWLWVANDENCGICRMAFNGCCPDSVWLSPVPVHGGGISTHGECQQQVA